jgi:chromate transporter
MAGATLWDIAATFLPISIVTVGGGNSVVPDIHRQMVEVHGWLTETQFLDAFAISRMAPGPGSLLVTLLGWQVAGAWGAVIATAAMFLPASLMIYVVANLYDRYQGARFLTALTAGLRPIGAGLILSAVYVLMHSISDGWIALACSLASTAILIRTTVNPLVVIGCGAALFLGFHAAGVV